MKTLTMNLILQDAKGCNNENVLKTSKLQFAQFLEKHPEQRSEIISFLTELLEASYDETNQSVQKEKTNPEIETSKMYDLNAYCRLIGVKSNSKEYQNIRQKLAFARDNNQIKGEQQILLNGATGKKYFYSIESLKEFTLIKVAERYQIFNESIKSLLNP